MQSLRQFKLYGSGVSNMDCASSAETHYPAVSVQPRQPNGEARMKVTIEINIRHTFTGEVSEYADAEKLQNQLIQLAKTNTTNNIPNYPILPDNVSHKKTHVDGGITFADLRW